MKTFLGVYMGAPPRGEQEMQDRETIERGMAAWMKWMTDHADIIEVTGGPLGRTKAIGPDGVTDIRNQMTGFVIIKADSHEAAAKLFENHPHFAIFPGDRVEVMEQLPMPTM